MPEVWLRETADGVTIDVLAAPRASRSRVMGEHDGRLRIQLAAPPVDGEANLALVLFVARQLGVARTTVSIVSGEASKRKLVLVRGARIEDVRRGLANAI